MRIWEIKGYVTTPGHAQVRFSTVVHALDRSSAVALATGTYGSGPNQKINISYIKDVGKSPMKTN